MEKFSKKTDTIPTIIWWNKRRLRYNIGLVIAGLIAFISYVFVVQTLIIPKDNSAEITIFTILFQGFGYLIMILIANVLYFIGPLSERLFRPRDTDRFRKITFGLGLWFSIALPFSILITLIILNI
jgi:uncharacterized protein YacL